MKKDQKSHKSNVSLNSSHLFEHNQENRLNKFTDLNDSKASLGSSKSQENKIKKRLAPAPPPSHAHDNIDKCLLQNIYSYAKKKAKAPAPPPPQPPQPPQPKSQEQFT